jgi:hypothetical protein
MAVHTGWRSLQPGGSARAELERELGSARAGLERELGSARAGLERELGLVCWSVALSNLAACITAKD